MTDDPISRALQTDDAWLTQRWDQLTSWLQERFGRETGLEAVLFLIGIQSVGRGYEPKLQKETKQDLIMEGTYCAFERIGLYRRIGEDERGLGVWERIVTQIPALPIPDQEKLLRVGVLSYFEEAVGR